MFERKNASNSIGSTKCVLLKLLVAMFDTLGISRIGHFELNLTHCVCLEYKSLIFSAPPYRGSG